MLCYGTVRYAMLCYAMLCYAMLCYAVLCYAMLCCAMLCYAMVYMLCCEDLRLDAQLPFVSLPSLELFGVLGGRISRGSFKVSLGFRGLGFLGLMVSIVF